MIYCAAICRTTNYRFHCVWPTAGEHMDFDISSKVGTWIGKNARPLDKSTAIEAVKLISDQFPQLSQIDAVDSHGRAGRYDK